MLALLVAIPLMGMAAAQAPPGDDILLVNAGREFVERKKEGGFIARPVYDRQIDALYYANSAPRTRETGSPPCTGCWAERRG